MADRPRIALRVADRGVSLDFYTRTVGFVLRERDDLADRAIIVDCDGDPLLLAGPNAGDISAALATNSTMLDHGNESLNFASATDLAAFKAQLLARGAPAHALSGPTTTRWGSSALTLEDPDGYRLIFPGVDDLS